MIINSTNYSPKKAELFWLLRFISDVNPIVEKAENASETLIGPLLLQITFQQSMRSSQDAQFPLSGIKYIKPSKKYCQILVEYQEACFN